jgi:hypothetical protein
MATQPTEARTLNGDLIEPGDTIREVRQLARRETVLSVRGTTLVTDRGTLHATKAVLIRKGPAIRLDQSSDVPR